MSGDLGLIYKRTKSENHKLVIKLPIGDFEFEIGLLGLEIGNFR